MQLYPLLSRLEIQIMQSIGNITQPRTIEYEDGVYIGELLGNVPHGRGFLSFDEDASHGSAVYFGGFNQGEEEGFGTIFQDGSISHGVYSGGMRINDAPLTDAVVIYNLQRDMFTMFLLINHLNEDYQNVVDEMARVANKPEFEGENLSGQEPIVTPDGYAWICDVCNEAKFRTFEEAVEHENACKGCTVHTM